MKEAVEDGGGQGGIVIEEGGPLFEGAYTRVRRGPSQRQLHFPLNDNYIYP